jgi:NAD(P)-dependent dehydrogenase (short-subunit alcohol dehydrogenase family)
MTVALVTGGASGLGRATAVGFAETGAQVLVADVNEDGGRETVDLVAQAGGEALFVETDVTNPEAVNAMVAAAVAAFGSLDAAVNCAGTTGGGGFTADYDVEEWRRTMALNLDSVFYCLKAEIPVMLGQGSGAIVNVASGAGLTGFAGLPAYVASKHGVVGLTRASALEYATQGIRINAVCPGSTLTPMLEGFMGDDENVQKMMRRSVPMRRLGRPEEIAAAIVWLCSDAASFVTGHAMAVDGGSVA